MNQPTKLKTLLVLSLSGLVLAACSPASEPETTEQDPTESTSEPVDTDSNADTDTDDQSTLSQNLLDWLPMKEDTTFVYDGEGDEFASFKVYPQFIHSDTLQFSESNGGTTNVKLYEYSENEVREVFVRDETYFRDDLADTGLSSEQEDFEILIQAPVEIGKSWESPSGSISEISDANVEIDTPSGTYSALEITRTLDNQTTKLYYAKDIGLVQKVSEPDSDSPVTSSLSEIQADTKEEIPFSLYELNEMATALTTKDASLVLSTNDPARLQLTEILNGETDDMTIPTLTDNAMINYLYLGNDQIVHVDFSEELVTEMNAGAGIESLLIQSLVNTIGSLYQVDEVLLTVEDQPYASGHLSFEEGQTMSVDLSNIE
ncbi:GerMN domain-containing protein [Marinilactibacillus kalidii]|uniref:GerMN domain-containing protein n=1 Tax=Marinilactibacillus kalidii TaxID=2820274 RepID=UPI001ABE2F97|nr:GerMN domain-containing protein [Marinilactibacillus kalidii]